MGYIHSRCNTELCQNLNVDIVDEENMQRIEKEW
jgi:hypothetical protein